jgi:hypothetical protein
LLAVVVVESDIVVVAAENGTTLVTTASAMVFRALIAMASSISHWSCNNSNNDSYSTKFDNSSPLLCMPADRNNDVTYGPTVWESK